MKKIYFVLLLYLVQSIDPAFLGGRWLKYQNDHLADWPGVYLTFKLSNASYLYLELGDYTISGVDQIGYRLSVWENNQNYGSIKILHTQNQQVVKIADKLIPSSSYTFQILKITEANFGSVDSGTLGPWILRDILTDGTLQVIPQKKLKFLFIGDSITCGFGVDGKFPCNFSGDTENVDHTYARFVADYFQADYQMIAWSGKGVVRNNGEKEQRSQITMRQLFERTLANNDLYYWQQSLYLPDLVSINLGTNDYSGTPWPVEEEFIDKYTEFVVKISNQFPSAKFILCCGPMIEIQKPCENIQTVVQKSNELLGTEKIKYVNMMGLMTDDDLGCSYHPNINSQLKMAAVEIQEIKEWFD